MSMPMDVWVPGGSTWAEHISNAATSPLRVHVDEDVPTCAQRVRVLVSGTPKPAWLDRLPALEAVVIPYAGVPPKTVALLEAHPHVALHNVHHNADPTAEMALALLLAVAKRVVPVDGQLRTGDWRFRYEEPTAWTLAGRRAVVFGWGAIGQRVGRMLEALQMRVTGIGRAAPLEPALEGAHVLVVCAPATAETRGLFDARRLGLLAEGAFVVNVARGALVDEAALFEALSSGHIGGAGLDVWWQYPREEAARTSTPPSRHAFDALPQVVFSPHRGGLTVETEALRGAHVARVLDQIANREPPDNRVDLEAGY